MTRLEQTEPDTTTLGEILKHGADAVLPTDLDFSIDTAMAPGPTNRMANATWRILEEQRVNALEIVAECDETIAKLLAKRDDALKAAAMCAAGQKGVS